MSAEKVALDPEFAVAIDAAGSFAGEWNGPGHVPPHAVAHQDQRTSLVTVHLHFLPEQFDHLILALRDYDDRNPGSCPPSRAPNTPENG